MDFIFCKIENDQKDEFHFFFFFFVVNLKKSQKREFNFLQVSKHSKKMNYFKFKKAQET